MMISTPSGALFEVTFDIGIKRDRLDYYVEFISEKLGCLVSDVEVPKDWQICFPFRQKFLSVSILI